MSTGLLGLLAAFAEQSAQTTKSFVNLRAQLNKGRVVEVGEEAAQLAATLDHDQRMVYFDETTVGRVHFGGFRLGIGNRGVSSPVIDRTAETWGAVKDTTDRAVLRIHIVLLSCS